MANIVDNEILERELNSKQAEAAKNTEGAMLILAGAGSGKTRTITYKIAHLVSGCGIDPRRILAVTFTNKAAREMKERIQKILDAKVQLEWMGTFHSVCVKILRLCLSKSQIVSALGWKLNNHFVIYDDDDQKRVIKEILKDDLGESFEASEIKKVRGIISKYKNSVYKRQLSDGTTRLVLQTPEQVKALANFKDEERYALYYEAYQNKLMDANAMDFDDLLLKTVDLLQKLPMIAAQFANRFEYVFVDEYQDTNDVQYELLKLLMGSNRNITVVGDDDQSIYGWRGANIEIIRNFHKDFTPVQIVKLEQNYRSTSNIVKGAGAVISHNERPKEMQKEVFSNEEPGDPIRITYLDDDRAEAEEIAKRIFKAGLEEYAETAIFYRTNAQSRVLEKALNDKRIPNVIFGGTRFWDRKEVKDILAYLRLIVNPKDDAAFFRVINQPPRQIGKTTVEKIQECGKINDLSAWDVIETQRSALGRSLASVEAFYNLILKLRQELESGEIPLPILVEHVISYIHYKDFLEKDDESSADERKANIDELINAIREFDEENPSATMDSFLQDISLLTDADKKEESKTRVTLMTIHMAKGLEFKNVHIAGCDEGVFPLTRSSLLMSPSEQKEHTEEERRLFYVGCTRAMKKLYLYHTKQRFMMGSIQQFSPSKFLSEIDIDVVELQERFSSIQSVRLFDESGMSYGKSFTSTGTIRRSFTYDKPAKRPVSPILKKTSFKLGTTQAKTSSGPKIVYDEYSENPLRPGVHVRHVRFGKGVLLKVYGSGENTRAEVRFADGTVRTLVLKFASLEIIG